MQITINGSEYDFKTLRTTLEEEIDRNGKDYPDINLACKIILDQLPGMKKEQIGKIEVMRMYKVGENGGVIKAFCDLQFGDDYVVKGFKVVEGKDGLFVGYPSAVAKQGNWYNTFVPLDQKIKEKIEDIIIGAYEE